MRHSKLDLTMNVYTDPKLLDIAGAMETLPALPSYENACGDGAALMATGTDNAAEEYETAQSAHRRFAPKFAPTAGKMGPSETLADKMTDQAKKNATCSDIAASAYPVKRNSPLTTPVNELRQVGATGLEPVTSSLSSNPGELGFSARNQFSNPT
jgi:hypothetical protein